MYTYIYYFTSFPCYIEFYVAMELDLADEFGVAPNGRHNLFKCSMCDIFRIARNMLPPQYLFRLSFIFLTCLSVPCATFRIVRNMLPPQYLFRLSFIFSATAPSPGEGPPGPTGPPLPLVLFPSCRPSSRSSRPPCCCQR